MYVYIGEMHVLHRICTWVCLQISTVMYKVRCSQGITKICRLSWLTNSALVYEPKCGSGGGGGVAGSQPMSTVVQGTQINFRNLTSYLPKVKQLVCRYVPLRFENTCIIERGKEI
jgi:hypothetical protein